MVYLFHIPERWLAGSLRHPLQLTSDMASRHRRRSAHALRRRHPPLRVALPPRMPSSGLRQARASPGRQTRSITTRTVYIAYARCISSALHSAERGRERSHSGVLAAALHCCRPAGDFRTVRRSAARPLPMQPHPGLQRLSVLLVLGFLRLARLLGRPLTLCTVAECTHTGTDTGGCNRAQRERRRSVR